MRVSLLYHVRQARSFWDSAKELGVIPFLVFTLAWWIASFLFVLKMPSFLLPPVAFIGFIPVLLSIGIFLRKSHSMQRYQILHPIVLEECEIAQWRCKKTTSDRGDWKPNDEEYMQPFLRFPLFRFTKKFLGEKQISVDLKATDKPHVIILVLESFRSKALKACDPTAPEFLTPCFNRLAKEGVLWRQFYCASARSCKALLATLYGVSSKEDSEIFKNQSNYPLRGLPDIFREQQYFNALLQGGDLEFDSIRAFSEMHGFDLAEGAQEIAAKYQYDTQENLWGLHDEFLMKRAIELLKENDRLQKPTFLNMYTISNHHPWRLPPRCDEQVFYQTKYPHEQRFQQTVHYTDRCLGAFVDELKKSGLMKKTILFVTGDHGQGFCEHGDGLIDREGLYEEYIWVPLLMLAEGRQVQPRVVEEVASQQDILPTILDLFGLPTFHHAMGRSLLRSSKEASAMFHSPFFPSRFGLRKSRWKWIVNPETQEEELYDLIEDPQEKNNVAGRYPDVSASLSREAVTKRNFLGNLFMEKALFPTQDTLEEDRVVDCRGRQDLLDEELGELIAKTSPTILKLDDCINITDRVLARIAPYCGMLKILSVRNCTRISIAGLEAICGQARRLRNLDISHCLQLEERELKRLFIHGHSLHTLSLEGLVIASKNILSTIVSQTGHLRSLSLLETPLIDEDVNSIVRHCKELKFLRLDARGLTDQSLEWVAKECRHLVGINFSVCMEFTDIGLSQLMHCTNLYSAILIDCPKATGRFLKDWKRLFLSNLYLRNLPYLDDEAIGDILDHPIKELQIQECPGVSDHGIKRLAELGAKAIHIVGCPNISSEAIKFLRKNTETVYWG